LKKSLLQWLCVSACLAAGAAGAGEADNSAAPVVHLGGASVFPGLSVQAARNDSIFRSDSYRVSSYVTVLSPSVLLQANRGADAYSLSYGADIGSYAQSHADDYADQDLLGTAKLALSARASLRVTPEFKAGHDDRGSTNSGISNVTGQFLTATPDTYYKTGGALQFAYGADGSPGRVELGDDYRDVQYQNNRSVTAALDKTLNDVSGTFFYRVSPKVSAFVQVSDTRIAYKASGPTYSGNENAYLLGATWEATAQTTGKFKVGQLKKTFDAPQYAPYSGSSWQGDIRWSPRQFVNVEWVTGRQSYESTGVGNFVLTTSNTLDVGYDLNTFTRLHLSLAQVTDDFVGTPRTDSTPGYGLKAEYKLRKWLLATAEFDKNVKTSTGYQNLGGYLGASPNYTQNVFAVGVHSVLY
jgi:hypothetical protein